MKRTDAIRNSEYNVGPTVRAACGAALALFDLNRRKTVADRRVELARERLAKVDVVALQAELANALAEQAAIDQKLTELQGSNVLMAG